MEKTVEQLNASLITLQRTLWRTDQVMAGLGTDAPMYQEMQQTMKRLRGTLQNIDQLTRTLKNRPSELLFSSQPKADPIPRKDP